MQFLFKIHMVKNTLQQISKNILMNKKTLLQDAGAALIVATNLMIGNNLMGRTLDPSIFLSVSQ
jgi:hypothetical protein